MIDTTHTKPARHFAHASLASAIVLALSSAPTLAQDADESAQVEQISVTGSRIVRRDVSAPSPIVTVNENFIEDTGEINIEATLNEMPQFTRDSSGR